MFVRKYLKYVRFVIHCKELCHLSLFFRCFSRLFFPPESLKKFILDIRILKVLLHLKSRKGCKNWYIIDEFKKVSIWMCIKFSGKVDIFHQKLIYLPTYISSKFWKRHILRCTATARSFHFYRNRKTALLNIQKFLVFNDILKSWNVLAKIFNYVFYIEGGAKRGSTLVNQMTRLYWIFLASS